MRERNYLRAKFVFFLRDVFNNLTGECHFKGGGGLKPISRMEMADCYSIIKGDEKGSDPL